MTLYCGLLTIRSVSQAEANAFKEELHLLRAKQAPPTKQPKSKAAKKKGVLKQASAALSHNDTQVSCACYTPFASPAPHLPPPSPPPCQPLQSKRWL